MIKALYRRVTNCWEEKTIVLPLFYGGPYLKIKQIDMPFQTVNQNFIVVHGHVDADTIFYMNLPAPQFFMRDSWLSRKADQTWLVRDPSIDGITASERAIFCDRMRSYRDIAGFDNLMEKYPTKPQRLIVLSMESLIRRMCLEKRQTEILLALVAGETKQAMIASGRTTLDEVQTAINHLYVNIPYYGYSLEEEAFLKDAVQTLNCGQVEFCCGHTEFCKDYEIPAGFLEGIIKRLLMHCTFLTEEEIIRFQSLLLAKDMDTLPRADKDFLHDTARRLYDHHSLQEQAYYEALATPLLVNGYVYASDLRQAAMQNGCHYHKLYRACQQLGVKPSHHIRRKLHTQK